MKRILTLCWETIGVRALVFIAGPILISISLFFFRCGIPLPDEDRQGGKIITQQGMIMEDRNDKAIEIYRKDFKT